MAARLEIHIRTVDFHLANIRGKLRADCLVRVAVLLTDRKSVV